MSEIRKHDQAPGPLAWMAGNSVAANLLMLILILGGILYAYRIKKEVFPEFSLDRIQVTVAYPGASPEEVEQGVVLAIEEGIRSVEGIKEVISTATEGRASVRIELMLGADLQKVYQDIQQQVDRIPSLPDDTERPQVTAVSRRRDVISFAIYGRQDEYVLRELAEQVRDQLLESEKITQVELDDVRDFETTIEISQDVLRAHGLTLQGVAATISRSAVEIPGGGIKTEGGEILLRMRERRLESRDFLDLPIIDNPDGSAVLLKEIAAIRDGFEDSERNATFNGQPAVTVDVYRVGDQTPLDVSAEAHKVIDRIKDQLPPGIGLTIRRDRSTIYRQRMELLLRNAYIGLALVLCLLGLFLEARLAFWVTMGIPISFLGAFLLLPSLGVTVNMISMFAFIVALGIVVDDAIVVGENIYENLRQGQPPLSAAIRGVRDVAMPVTFSVLTNVATFTPLLFVSGFMGKIFRNIPYVVCLVFLISLIECLFILPAHLGHRRHKRRGMSIWLHARQQAFSAWFMESVRRFYGPLIKRVLHYRYISVAVGLAVLISIVGFVAGERIAIIDMPRTESDRASVTVNLPYGSPTSRMEAVRRQIVEAAQTVIAENGGEQLCTGLYARIRGAEISARAYLTPPGVRPMSTREFAKIWRKRVGDVPGSESSLFESDRGGPGSGASLTIELSHRDTAVLEKACRRLADELTEFPVVKDIDDGFAMGKPQLDFKLTPSGRSLGLTATDIARQIRASFYGVRALRQQRGRDEVDVMVRLPENERVSEADLNGLLIRTPAGTDIPLIEAVTMARGKAYREIVRRDGHRTMTVTANVEPAKESQRVTSEISEEVMPLIQADLPGLQFAFRGRHARMAESMGSLKGGFIVAMLVVYAMLAIPLKSYAQPLIIMVSIPFGIVGAVIGHIIMGYNLSIMSMMGLVALSGVVVNDSLVLIDYVNRLRRQGLKPFEAVCQAGVRRFRPIMLTTLTTFGGLAPMIFETSRQARFMIPMALSLGFGILFATLITLLLVPCLYMMVEDFRRVSALMYNEDAA